MSAILYAFHSSSASWRVRIALAWKNIPYQYQPVSLAENQQTNPEYQKLNANSLIPTLIIDGYALAQSVAIMEYLEETRPHPPILPGDSPSRAKVREIVQIICADTQPLQNLRVLKYLDKSQKAEWPRYWIHRNFVGLERLLKTTAGDYCFGNSFTMADICLVPQVFNANRFKVDPNEFPTIMRINEKLQNLPVIQVSHPTKQPGYSPPKNKTE